MGCGSSGLWRMLVQGRAVYEEREAGVLLWVYRWFMVAAITATFVMLMFSYVGSVECVYECRMFSPIQPPVA